MPLDPIIALAPIALALLVGWVMHHRQQTQEVNQRLAVQTAFHRSAQAAISLFETALRQSGVDPKMYIIIVHRGLDGELDCTAVDERNRVFAWGQCSRWDRSPMQISLARSQRQ